MESTAQDFKMSTLAVAKALGIELEEIPDWTCCGSTPAHSTDGLLATSLSARNLMLAESMGCKEVVTCCAACYSRLAMANLAVANDPKLRADVAESIGSDYGGDVKVRHFMQVLDEDLGLAEIRNAVHDSPRDCVSSGLFITDGPGVNSRTICDARTSLAGLKVACYYGCLLTRPKELSIVPDAEDPQLMEGILAAAGADPIEWPYKNECCGASFSITRTETVKRLSAEILRMAKQSGADCVAVACPLCQSNLDLRQADIEAATGEKFELPVFYFTQLLGKALGISDSELGINQLMTDPAGVLARLGR